MGGQLFNREALAARRRRAERMGFAGGADFLHARVAAAMADRLAEVTRRFEAPALLGWAAADRVAGVAAKPQLPGADETLPLAEAAHDLVLSLLLMHSLNDPVGHLIQLRRALRPDGLALVALFGGQTLNELRASLAEAEAEITGGLSMRVSPMGEIRDLGGLLQRAGFALPVADSDRIEVSYATPFHLMRELRAMGETSVLTNRPHFLRRDVLARASELYTKHFSARDGRIRATFEIVFLTGWSPAPDQPQPLRPGSATSRLADALGTDEHSAGEKAGGGGRKQK